MASNKEILANTCGQMLNNETTRPASPVQQYCDMLENAVNMLLDKKSLSQVDALNVANAIHAAYKMGYMRGHKDTEPLYSDKLYTDPVQQGCGECGAYNCAGHAPE